VVAFLGSVTAFTAVSFFLIALFWRQQDSMAARVQALRRWRPRGVSASRDEPFAERILLPTLSSVGRLVASVLPANVLAAINQRLVMAGSPLTLNAFLVTWLMSTLAGPALYLAVFFLSGAIFNTVQFFLLLSLAGAGTVLPHLWLNMRVAKRKDRIWRSLPDSFDLITTCVEAGLALDAALAHVAQKVPGAFADELDIALTEIGLGRPRREALLDMAKRTGVDDVIGFVNAIVQAEQMGTSIGPVLRTQAENLRMRRRQRAEQEARRAPFKMLFPIMFCILPSLFVVVLGPAVITLYRLLGE